MYTEDMLARVAKRENNNKRKYLVVNPLQGKHIPVSGRQAEEMFGKLAEFVERAYLGEGREKLLLVGFAETATAIGAGLAVKLNTLYMQTTREPLENDDYLFFTESHSHAEEQTLCKSDVESVIHSVDRVVFVEDEVTTGNTIMKIIDIIENMYPGAVRFAVASLLNGMDTESMKRYSSRNIDVHYLVKTHHEGYTKIAEDYHDNGSYIPENAEDCGAAAVDIAGGYINTRRLCSGEDYKKACVKLADEIIKRTPLDDVKNVAVIGTEEFMFPAIDTARRLEEMGCNAVTHSTTRSPIAVSRDSGYPLESRYTLTSLYDGSRRTFIYSLKKYDCVIIITDSPNISAKGLNTLVNALRFVGNTNIYIYRWCGNE